MPPHSVRKIVFDTNIYIGAIHGGSTCSEYALLLEFLPVTYLSSVVSAELFAGATGPSGTRLVERFVSRSERVGRVVTPTLASWNEAGRILAKITRQEPEFKTKLCRLFNDVLIAMSALQVGATVYTKNEQDFQLIRRYKRFSLQIPSARGEEQG
jgi:predicted nucleic acid-binding protein